MSHRKLKPTNEYLLLNAVEASGVSKGGIIIPEAHKEKVNQGIICEIGEGVPDQLFKVGEAVMFPLHAEYRMTFDEKKYIAVKWNDIVCSIVPDENPA